MINLKWHKLGNDKKGYIKSANKLFIFSPTILQKERILDVLKENKEFDLLIIGVLNDEWIPGLEGGKQFKPAKMEDIIKILEECSKEIQEKILLLQYSFEHLKYIIRELAPQKILAFNGTWKDIVHYQDFWWEAYDQGVEIETISPFTNEKASKEYSLKLTEEMQKEFDKKWPVEKEYKVDEIHQMLSELSQLSWDWTGRVSAIITKKGDKGKYEIVARNYNKVVPYNGYMQHKGSLREQNHAQIGERIELGETVHAEINCLIELTNKKVSLKDSQIWVQTFPCPYCARSIAASSIEEIKYFNEYTNPLGYEVLEKSGKEIENIKV